MKKLYEPITPQEVALLDVDEYFRKRGTKVVMFSIPATNPAHEHSQSKESHKEALAESRAGRIKWKVL